MSNAPKRPTIDDPSQAVIEWIDAANAYADHLEQRVRELEADNKRLRDALSDIIRHQHIVAGGVANGSATVMIARAALERGNQ